MRRQPAQRGCPRGLLTGDPQLAADAAKVAGYARRSIPYAVAVGFIAGFTADAVFARLTGLSVVQTVGVDIGSRRI
jgi:hypothetical protein